MPIEDMTPIDSHDGPVLRVWQQGHPRNTGPGRWEVSFEVVNDGQEPVRLLAAWLPHGRFRCEERPLDDLPPLAAGAGAVLAFPVIFDEPKDTPVENAFVILRIHWRSESWRVLARLTVTATDEGAPSAVTETVTVHRVGFAR